MKTKYNPEKEMFEVYTKIKYGKQHYGYYHTQEAANKIIILLEMVGTDYSKLPDKIKKFFKNKGLNEFPIIKNKRKNTPGKNKFYTYNKNTKKWIVQKTTNGKRTIYARFKTENEAKAYVEFLKEHNWDTRYNLNKPHKYYTLQKGKYNVRKYLDGKAHLFGRYLTETEAKKAVKYFQKHNWNTNLKTKAPCKNYTYISRLGLYRIQKVIDGKRIYYGLCDSEENAKKIVAELKKVDWNKKQLSKEYQNLFHTSTVKGKDYHYNNKRGVYMIQKSTSGAMRYIGYVKTEQDAQQIVTELNHNGWNRNKLSRKSKALLLNSFHDGEPKYYTKTRQGKYRITKAINGRTRYYLTVDSEDEAKRVVELLKQNNWNKKCLA